MESKFRLSSNLSFGRSNTSHPFSLADEDPILYQQAIDQGIDIPNLIDSKDLWTVNWNNSFNYALSLNTQFRASLPLLFQSEEFLFELQETGAAYTPPDGMESFFHQDRRILGVGDAELAGQYFHFLSNFVLGAELGVKVPTGKVTSTDYSFAEYRQGLGTGIFVPITKLFLFSRDTERGLIASLGAQTPLYDNTDGYRTGSSFNGNAGYWLRWKNDYVSMLQLIGMYQTGDQLQGLDIPQSHRSNLGLSFMQTGPINDNLEWLVGAQQPLWIRIWEKEPRKVPKMTIFSFGLTWL